MSRMRKTKRINIPGPLRRLFTIPAILLIMFQCLVVPVGISHAKSMDEMIPEDNQPHAIYNEYDVDHYAFQTLQPDRHFWEIGEKASDGMSRLYDVFLSTIFGIGIQITRFFNFITREAFEFTFMNSLITGVELIIENLTGIRGGNLGDGLWNSLFGVFAGITLLFVLWQVVRLRFLDSLQTMFSFILALVVAFTFFANVGTFLRFVNDASNELAATMYTGLAIPGGLSTSETSGVQAISNQVWMELVMKPYTMLQFDDPDAYTTHPDIVKKVLKTEPLSDDREKALKDASSTYPAVSRIRSSEQMVILACNAVFSIVILGLFCFWSIATIFIRFKLLIHACVMSVTLLASLLPGREAGLSVVRTQFLKLIGLALMTAFTMFFLDLSLVTGHLIFSIVYAAHGGWFTGMLLESIVVFVVFKYRNEIGSVFSKAAGHMPIPTRTKSITTDALQRNVARSLYNKAGVAMGNMFSRRKPEGVPNTFNPNSLSKAGDNLNDATTASMQLRYQREKEAAEQYSTETGQPVQYTPFVQKVNENLQSGTKNPFRGMDKDWKEEKARLKGIKDDGGDVKQAILSRGVSEDMNDQQIAARMYTNENAIRTASSFMVNRPKAAVNQMKRAATLNKNRRLETTVNDFVVIELFERYKVEYKQAIDTASATGEPVQHTDFVKSMDERFKMAGLNTTQKVNEAMLTRKGRFGAASKFESMPAFVQKKEDLLRANEAFRQATAPKVGIAPVVSPMNVVAPLNAVHVLRQIGCTVNLEPVPAKADDSFGESVPKELLEVKDMSLETSSAVDILAKPKVNTQMDLSQVNVQEGLKTELNAVKKEVDQAFSRNQFTKNVVLPPVSTVPSHSSNAYLLMSQPKVEPAFDMSRVTLSKKTMSETAQMMKESKIRMSQEPLKLEDDERVETGTNYVRIIEIQKKIDPQVSNQLRVIHTENIVTNPDRIVSPISDDAEKMLELMEGTAKSSRQ